MRNIDLLTIKQLKRLVKERNEIAFNTYSSFAMQNFSVTNVICNAAYYLKDKIFGFNVVGNVEFNYKSGKCVADIDRISKNNVALIKPILDCDIFGTNEKIHNNIFIFGFYPKSYANLNDSEINELNKMQRNNIFKTGRRYAGLYEYYYKGNYYVEYCSKWFLVDKLTWYYDKEDDILICKDAIANSTFWNYKTKNIYEILDILYYEITQKIEEPNLLLSLEDVEGTLDFIVRYGNSDTKTDFCNKLSEDKYYSERDMFVPKLKYSDVLDKGTIKKLVNGKTVLTFGEYPTKKCNIDIPNKTNLTNKIYTVNDYDTKEKYFVPLTLQEFTYNGKKYVQYKNDCYEVEELTWTLDSAGEYFTCDNSLFPINDSNTFSYIDKYVYKYFSKEIIPSKTRLEIKSVEKIDDKERIKELLKSNPIYGMMLEKRLITLDDLEVNEENTLVLKK